MQSIKELLEKLPPDLQKEVTDFAEFLLQKQAKKNQRRTKV